MGGWGGRYKKITGVRNPTTNDGSVVTSVTVPTVDAIFLVKIQKRKNWLQRWGFKDDETNEPSLAFRDFKAGVVGGSVLNVSTSLNTERHTQEYGLAPAASRKRRWWLF